MWASVEIGSVAAWVGSVGTIAALVVGLFTLRREFASADEERQRQRSAQAAHVSARILLDGEGYSIELVNASALPIFSVTVLVGAPAGHDPWTSQAIWLQVPPNAAERTVVDSSGSPTGAVILYDVTFKDSYGVGWRRGASGELDEIDPPDYLGCS